MVPYENVVVVISKPNHYGPTNVIIFNFVIYMTNNAITSPDVMSVK